MDKRITDMLGELPPQELATACTYERSALRNLFAEELCRRAGLLQRYHNVYADAEIRKVLDQAADKVLTKPLQKFSLLL